MPITTEQKASSVAHIRETEGFTPVEWAQLDAMSEAESSMGRRTILTLLLRAQKLSSAPLLSGAVGRARRR